MNTYSNTSIMLFSQANNSEVINLKTKTSQETSSSDFKSVFDSTMSNTAKRTNSTSSQDKKENSSSQASDSQLKYKSFKDIKVNQTGRSGKSIVKQTEGDFKTQEVQPENDSLKASQEKYDDQITALAQVLGMQPAQLVKLANELGFSADDLKDVKMLTLFMEKLANVLELNNSQKEVLIKLAKEVSSQLKPSENSVKEAVPETNDNIASKGDTQNDASVKTVNLSEIAEKIKTKLDELLQNGKASSESVSTEVSKVIAAMKAQSQVKVAASTEQLKAQNAASVSDTGSMPVQKQAEAEELAGTKEAAVKAKDSVKDDTVSNADSGKSNAKADIKSINLSAQNNAGNNQNTQPDQQNVQVIGDIKAAVLNNQTPVEKSVFSIQQPVKSSEIVNQVVEQAKVVIGQDKSEMVIQLKPDHLGKLELKVVTEQGIVAAKFVAENQKVKEVLETNMQLLKDSLQKQGISIDAVSVQVGNGSKNEYRQQNSFQSKSSSSKIKYGGNELGVAKNGINAFDALPERLAQYAIDSNTINLTA